MSEGLTGSWGPAYQEPQIQQGDKLGSESQEAKVLHKAAWQSSMEGVRDGALGQAAPTPSRVREVTAVQGRAAMSVLTQGLWSCEGVRDLPAVPTSRSLAPPAKAVEAAYSVVATATLL